MNLDAVLSFLAAALRTATPIALATLACTISERAGVINIGIEGTMIASAFTGAVGAYYSGSAWVGLLCGAAAGILPDGARSRRHRQLRRQTNRSRNDGSDGDGENRHPLFC